MKKNIATRLMRFPGGPSVVRGVRGVLSMIRGFSVSDTLREAHGLIMAGRPDLALAAHDKILARYPHDLPARFVRLQSLLRCDKLDEAYMEALTLQATPEFPNELRDQLNFRIAEAECRLGSITEALWKLRMDTDIPPRFNFAELMINDYADFTAAEAVYADTEKCQKELAAWFGPTIERTKFFSPDWVRLIGHIGLLDLCVKAFKLGWFAPADRMVLSAPSHLVANNHLLEYLLPFFERNESFLVAYLAENLGSRVACRLHTPNGHAPYFCEGMGAIQEQWDAEGRPPLLSLSPEDREYVPKLMRHLGIPPGAWIVALHARSPGFHWERGNPHQAHRNTDIHTYFPAVQEIVRRGGWVVRLGDRSMPKLPPMPRVVDYAHTHHKCERADVVLAAVSKFFIGCTSGLCHLPYSFGTPTLLTNWCSNQLPIFGLKDRFLPKRLRVRDGGRELTFAEMLEPANRIAAYSGTRLITRGFEWIDNTPDEILEAVKEMLDPPTQPNQWVRNYDRMARANGQYGFSRLSGYFAEKYAELLEDTAPPTVAPTEQKEVA